MGKHSFVHVILAARKLADIFCSVIWPGQPEIKSKFKSKKQILIMFDKTASLLKKAGLAAPVYLVWPV